MKTIWKYPLPYLCDRFELKMPFGARCLDVQVQNGCLVLWALVDPEATLVRQSFSCVGTGHPFDHDDLMTYIATVQGERGLVWHFFHLR